MKANRKDTKSVLIDLAYKGSMNEFEEFYGFAVTYQELEQQSYIEFKEIMFESINSKIKFRKYGRIGNVLTVRAEMYEEEIELLSINLFYAGHHSGLKTSNFSGSQLALKPCMVRR